MDLVKQYTKGSREWAHERTRSTRKQGTRSNIRGLERAPWLITTRITSQALRVVGRGLNTEPFQPETTLQTMLA